MQRARKAQRELDIEHELNAMRELAATNNFVEPTATATEVDPIEADLVARYQATYYEPWEAGTTVGRQTIERRHTEALGQLMAYRRSQFG